LTQWRTLRQHVDVGVLGAQDGVDATRVTRQACREHGAESRYTI
jgi:hypothetical protein